MTIGPDKKPSAPGQSRAVGKPSALVRPALPPKGGANRAGAEDGEAEHGEATRADGFRADGSEAFVVERVAENSGLTAGNVRGGTGDEARGSYCTAKYVADAVGPVDLDPFTNERSHIQAAVSCALESGGDGFGDKTPGSFVLPSAAWQIVIPANGVVSCGSTADGRARLRATSRTKTWIQPDYTETLLALRHYLHTRFLALLRFDPRPEWNELVGGAAAWIGVLSNSPGHRSFEFEFPPGYTGAGNTFPHAIYARHYEDVTPAMRALCCYPDGTARHWRKRSALDGDPSAVAAWLTRWGLDASLFATS